MLRLVDNSRAFPLQNSSCAPVGSSFLPLGILGSDRAEVRSLDRFWPQLDLSLGSDPEMHGLAAWESQQQGQVPSSTSDKLPQRSCCNRDVLLNREVGHWSCSCFGSFQVPFAVDGPNPVLGERDFHAIWCRRMKVSSLQLDSLVRSMTCQSTKGQSLSQVHEIVVSSFFRFYWIERWAQSCKYQFNLWKPRSVSASANFAYGAMDQNKLKLLVKFNTPFLVTCSSLSY